MIITKLHYTFLLFIFSTCSLFATHTQSGEIHVEQMGFLQYRATFTTYSDSAGAPADRDSLEICWVDGICEFAVRDNPVPLDFGIQLSTYTIEHTYTSVGRFMISMTDRNRPAGIVNLNAPNSEQISYHLETAMN